MSAVLKIGPKTSLGTAKTISEMKRNIEFQCQERGTIVSKVHMEVFESCVNDFLRNRIAVLFGKMGKGISSQEIQQEIIKALK